MKPVELPNFGTIDRDLGKLHPIMRVATQEILRICETERMPFHLFEGYRYPQRQRTLYATGRTKPGSVMTANRPWESFHNFGLAADFALLFGDAWVSTKNGIYDHWWNRLHEIGGIYGMCSAEGEPPHLQVDTLELSDLRAGRFPGGGDATWEANLALAMKHFPIQHQPDRRMAV